LIRAAAAAALVVVVAVGCGSGGSSLDAKGRALPSLASRCGVDVDAKVGWFRASDGVLLDGATLGSGPTGVVLAHEYPNDLCGWRAMPASSSAPASDSCSSTTATTGSRSHPPTRPKRAATRAISQAPSTS
jgi:hypothetical protein